MSKWLLIIMIYAADAGAEVETIPYSDKSACAVAAEAINKIMRGEYMWGRAAVCVEQK